MPIQPGLSLMTQQADVAPAINQAAAADQQAAAFEQQQQLSQSQEQRNAEMALKAHYETMSERDKQRLQSTVVMASRLKPYLDRGDVEGAHGFLTQRQQALHDRMATGENIDDQETAYALDKLRTGDTAGLQTDIASILAAGQVYGMSGSAGGARQPASITEWQYYNSLSPEDQQRWMRQKRSDKVANLGGESVVIGPDGNPVSNFQHTLRPEDRPGNAGAKAYADAAGTAYGREQGEAAAKLAAMEAHFPRLLETVAKLKGLAQKATYTPAGELVNAGTRFLGLGATEGGIAKADYESTALNETLPILRLTFGAQFTAAEGDRLVKTFGDPKLSPQEKTAALEATIQQKQGEIESLARQVNSQRQPSSPQGQQLLPPPPLSGPVGAPPASAPQAQVTVSNGRETYTIDAADLQHALAEGFQQIQ